MVRTPSEKKGQEWKLARPFLGPYRVLSLTATNAEVRLVDQPDEDPIYVSLCRVHPCNEELPDVSWTGRRGRKNRKKRPQIEQALSAPSAVEYSGPITRSRSKSSSVVVF